MDRRYIVAGKIFFRIVPIFAQTCDCNNNTEAAGGARRKKKTHIWR
jgi:hypothetical protein